MLSWSGRGLLPDCDFVETAVVVVVSLFRLCMHASGRRKKKGKKWEEDAPRAHAR
jgi:hypothetical protein